MGILHACESNPETIKVTSLINMNGAKPLV